MRANLVLLFKLTMFARLKIAYGVLCGTPITFFHVNLSQCGASACPECPQALHVLVSATTALEESPSA